MATEQVFQAQTAHEAELLSKANVVGVAVGFKEEKGETQGELSVVVLVEQKKPLAALSASDIIPPELEGIRTDVYEVGYLRAFQQTPRDRYRPVIPNGVSIGHYQVTAGTLGTIVKDRITGERFLLSNNHVFANANDAQLGDAILQPAAMDGGKEPGDLVARLDRYWSLVYIDDPADAKPRLIAPAPTTPTNGGGTTPPPTNGGSTPPDTSERDGCLTLITGLANLLAVLSGSDKRVAVASAASVAQTTAMPAPTAVAQASTASNLVDCALAKPIDPNMFTDNIVGIGVVDASKPAALGMRVRKHGRTTGYTEGNITLLNATVNVAYNTLKGPRTARFTGQIIAEGMSKGGDSGSLIVDTAESKAVGLLFAGSDLATIFTPMDVVLEQLGIVL